MVSDHKTDTFSVNHSFTHIHLTKKSIDYQTEKKIAKMNVQNTIVITHKCNTQLMGCVANWLVHVKSVLDCHFNKRQLVNDFLAHAKSVLGYMYKAILCNLLIDVIFSTLLCDSAEFAFFPQSTGCILRKHIKYC